MPYGCTAILLYAEDIEEYTFLTPQATKALKAYFIIIAKIMVKCFTKIHQFLQHVNFVPKQLGWSGVRSVIYRTIQKSKISRLKCDNRFDVQADHGFRKRFNTILKLDNSVNYNIAEKLMGHKNGLDGVYLTPTIEELFAEFKKAIYKIQI